MKVKVNDFSGGLRLDKSENLSGFNYARRMENFNPSSGGLEVFKGAGEHLLSSLFSGFDLLGGRVFYYHKYDFDLEKELHFLVVFDATKTGYYVLINEENPTVKPIGVQFTSVPNAINYRLNGEDVLILTSATDHMVVWNGKDSPEIILDAPKIADMDLHYERLFAVTSGGDSTELKFSDDLDPTNWSESLSDAGFISMVDERGKLLKVVSFNDYLYIFRKNGITRVYANTSLTTSFYVNHLFTLGGEILGDTVKVAGGQIMFLATDGFYLFDGADTRKCLDNIFPLIEFNGKECATYYNGCYYLACRIKSLDNASDLSNNAIIEISLSDLSVSILKYGTPESMVVVNNGEKSSLVVLNSAEECGLIELFGKDTKIGLMSVWETALSDFGDISSRKVVRRVTLKLLNPNSDKVSVTIFNERGESIAVSTLGETMEELLLFSGKQFGYKISTESKNLTVLAISFEIS